MTRGRTFYVWDPLQRLFHWALAASFVLSIVVDAHRHPVLHRWLGCIMMLLVLFRVVYGAAGPHYARFSHSVRSHRETLSYARCLRSGREKRYLGHSPLGGLMAILLLANIGLLALSGWMLGTPPDGPGSGMLLAHRVIAMETLALIITHVGAVLWASRRRQENLTLSMLTGRKREPSRGDIL
ncbi:cytochrome b/b6 domain-containing protein [Tianweitania sp.]|uniref:cytochrome b/b6 domain-containing protein n=1 Tax=Tianweitania sp. TaxID=2021634 RepID=UPI002899544A|nr:cytochrome b/b6 domain-containing protein [Tianweitania sp.]